MKSENIFIGTVKKCGDIYWYNQFGEERFVGDFKIGSSITGSIHKYVNIIDDKAILIKINEDKYIYFDMITTPIEKILLSLGIPVKVIGTQPFHSNELYVDKKTLKPYFQNENENISIKKLTLSTKIK